MVKCEIDIFGFKKKNRDSSQILRSLHSVQLLQWFPTSILILYLLASNKMLNIKTISDDNFPKYCHKGTTCSHYPEI